MSRFNLHARFAPPFRGTRRSLAPILAAIAIAGGCAEPPPAEPVICVTIAPLAMLVGPIADGRADVVTLLPPGASPHTFELSPSQARTANRAHVVFFVGDGLDRWVLGLGAREYIEVLNLADPASLLHYGPQTSPVIDPHFWMDPVLSMQVSLAIAARLSSLDLEYSEVYVKNALEIAQRLGALHDELSKLLEPYRGSAVVQHHPSMNYFFNRYGIRSLGAIEMAAGREPTPRELERLAQTMRLEGVKVVITEPQLPRDAVAAVAQMTGATIVEMDPIGGVPGRETYEELLRFNARSLADALE